MKNSVIKMLIMAVSAGLFLLSSSVNEVRASPVMPGLKIATFNIRTKAANEATLNPAELAWDLRKGPMIQDILDQQPDIISFQESRKVQVDDLIVGLQDVYNCTSITVWNGGDMLATCWNRDTINFLGESHFWLSETPETPYSLGWDATYGRAALVGSFQIKATEELFWAVNTHLDAAGAESRSQSANLIPSRVGPLIRGEATSGAPAQSLVFLLGDLNSILDTPAYTIFTGSRYTLPEGQTTPVDDTFIDLRREFGSDQTTPTNEAFADPKDPKSIDYIMVADNGALTADRWTVDDVAILPNEMEYNDATYIYSDHKMVVASLTNVASSRKSKFLM